MPTWVPDWTVADLTNPFHWELASRCSTSREHYKVAGIPSVTRIHLATVQHAERIKHWDTDFFISQLQRLADIDILRGSYFGRGQLTRRFLPHKYSSRFGDMYFPLRRELPPFQRTRDYLFALLQPVEKRVLDSSDCIEAKKPLRAVWSVCKNRSFIKIHEGYIGLGHG